jgi:drug/metabolite transporter (DMT)-like permease
MTNMGKLSRLQTILLIVFLVTVWGVNWPLTKIALSYTPPVLFSGIRTLLGGILLLLVAVPRYKRLNFKRTWTIYMLSALFNVVLYYGLQTIGLHYMPAGLFSTIVFLQPVLVGIFSWLWLGEAMYGLKVLGLILGFTGVGIISSGGLAGHISPLGILLAVGSALSWALGTVYVKKTGGTVDPIWLVTLQLIIGGMFMTAIGSAVEQWSDIVWSPVFVLLLLCIAVFVIAIGWLVFYRLIDSGEASKVSANTFLIPVVAIVIGTVFLNEAFTFSLVVGLLFIVSSIYFVNRPNKLM